MRQQILDFLRGRLDRNAVEFTTDTIYNEHGSLDSCDPLRMRDKIDNLLDEFAQDNDIEDEEFWMEYFEDEEVILLAL